MAQIISVSPEHWRRCWIYEPVRGNPASSGKRVLSLGKNQTNVDGIFAEPRII
ncbi:hypothetical protein KCP73_09870 [Salmonella enterica subsp. enterica]|nr:hypothetical protein KCP73_09870 [Salmonella enterica subsp. enterica]